MWGETEIKEVPNIMTITNSCKITLSSKIAAFLSYVGFAPTRGKQLPGVISISKEDFAPSPASSM